MNWSHKNLDELVKFQRGFDLPRDNFVDGNVPVYGSTSILGYHNRAKIKAPGVITGRSGTLGVFQYATKDYWPHNTSLWVKDFKGNSPKFVYYLLQCLDFKLFNSGGAVPTLNRNVLKGFMVDIPPISVQNKIESILTSYDDLIENNSKRIELLEEKAKITFKEWFICHRINQRKMKLDKNSGLPDGWAKIQIGEFIKFQKGKKASDIVENYKQGYIKLLLLDGIEGGTYLYTNPHKQVLAKRGDLIMLMDGARSSKVFFANEGAVGSTMAKIIIINKEVSPTLLKQFFEINFIWMQTNNTGAAIPHANKSFINRMPFQLPPIEILKKWKDLIEPIYLQIEILIEQNQLLNEAKNILLPRLMTGIIKLENTNHDYLKKVKQRLK
ncbi:MAG: restriction endonuclease subunit S [Ignavibacteriae bacterium]|nr:restriction endonuclease subunit S [Ignavibacteriota bacterium]